MRIDKKLPDFLEIKTGEKECQRTLSAVDVS
jgi:hypothetical protein